MFNEKCNPVYVMPEEQKQAKVNEIMALLRQYDYEPKEEHINTILDKWAKEKGWLINAMMKHPNYNGDFKIVFDRDYERKINNSEVCNFTRWLDTVSDRVLVEQKTANGMFTIREADQIADKLSAVIDLMQNMSDYVPMNQIRVNGMKYNEIRAERNRFRMYYSQGGGSEYTSESYAYRQKINHICYWIRDNQDTLISESGANRINAIMRNGAYGFKYNCVAGTKMSRVVNRVLTLLGVSSFSEYQSRYARYADAINPLHITRFTVFSVDPVDYYTMSFGNSWASCHTIDKENTRGGKENYSGCYSNGTQSYMLDGCSAVFYTVDSDWSGKMQEADKINRQMFHIGEEKIIQGRLYPQDNDSGAQNLYRQIREIVQKICADIFEVPNLWVNMSGTEECDEVTIHHGPHYRDLSNYANCNVSYWKRVDETRNTNIVCIGSSDTICVSCGGGNSWGEAVECSICYHKHDQVECCECGALIEREDAIEIDGQFYCNDCAHWCDYHNEYENAEMTHVARYGYVCERALEYGDFYQDDYNMNYYYGTPEVITEYGNMYHDIYNAEADGYTFVERLGEWHADNEVSYCESCHQYVLRGDYNDEREMCNVCCEENPELELVEEF